MNGLCKLCLKECEAICDSHIFTEFLYESSYDEKHRAVYFDPWEHSGRGLEQKGLRERLLCSSCETHLSDFEGHGASVLRRLPASLERCRPNTLVRVPDVDYKKFKLFTMSLLWRAAVSGITMFRKVQLGPHEERLRKMILEADPGEPWEYGCALNKLQDVDELLQSVVMFPGEMKLEGQRGFHALLWGLHWWWVVSSHSLTLPCDELFLSRSNQLPIRVSGTTASDLFRRMGERGGHKSGS